MTKLVSIMCLALAFVGSDCIAGVEGSVELLARKRFIDMPIVGAFDFTLTGATSLTELPTVISGVLEYRVVGPSGSEVDVRGAWFDFKQPCQVIPHEEVIYTNQRFVVPICLIKTEKGGFILSNIGRYELQVRLTASDGIYEFREFIDVESCDDCDRSTYHDALFESDYVGPFTSSIRAPGILRTTEPYDIAAGEVCAYYLGGSAMKVFYKVDFERLAGYPHYGSKRFQDSVENGAGIAATVGVNESFWGYLAGKSGAYAGGQDFVDKYSATGEAIFVLE